MGDRFGHSKARACQLDFLMLQSTAKYNSVSTNYEKIIEILKVESAAIDRAAANLDHSNVATALEILGNCKGKVIVCGVGKSGVIGQKISQTLTSTGTVSIFVNPSDALHGGLG